MKFVHKLACASLFATFLTSSCASSYPPIVDESLQKSTTFQLAIVGIRSYSMFSSSPVSNGQVFYGRAFSLYNDNGTLKLYSTGMIGELSGEPLAVLRIGKDKKVMLVEDLSGDGYIIVISEEEEKNLDFYKISSDGIEYTGRHSIDFDRIFVAGHFLLAIEKNELRLYSYENELLSLKKTIKSEKDVKVFSSHIFSSFIVAKKTGECLIVGEIDGKATIPPFSYNAALYYDGTIKKTYIVVFNKEGGVEGVYEVREW